MKIIEALKKIKELGKKADDIRDKIKNHSAHLDFETPVYENQKAKVSEWLQAHSDICKEVLRLRIAIQKTNLAVMVPIEIEGKAVEKSIAEWIHRRRDLAKAERNVWGSLTDRGLREGTMEQSTGERKEIKIIRCYDPEERDKKMAEYDSEPTIIDAKLEIVNATTDITE